MRAIVRFQKIGPAKFISHLDLLRAMQRALRRAGLPVAYSQGFNPHMLVSFASALPVGTQSLYEIMDVTLEGAKPPEDFAQRLSKALPDGLLATGARFVDGAFPSPMAVCERAGYLVRSDEDLSKNIAAFMEMEQVFAKKQGKKGMRDIDIRPMVYELSAQADNSVRMVIDHGSAGTLPPGLLLTALGAEGGYEVLRTGLYAVRGGRAVGLFDLKEEA